MADQGKALMGTRTTPWAGGMRRVVGEANAAELPDTEHGATVAHWLGGQWGQSVWADRDHADPET